MDNTGLTPALENLSVNEEKSNAESKQANPLKKRKTSKKSKLPQPKLEDYPSKALCIDPLYKGHLLFYGFYVNDDQILKIAIERGRPDKLADWSPMLWFLYDLMIATGYEYMELQAVVVDKDMPSGATVNTGSDGVPYVYVYSLCAWSKLSWRLRPTQAQVDMIKEIMGIEPRWYIDALDPQVYEEY